MNRARCLATAIACVLSTSATLAQSPAGAIAKTLQADYAVPDAPALTMLGVDPSKLLRPASVEQLTSNFATASGNFSFIPTAFAAEASPAMLIHGERLRLDQYQAHPFWYRTRVSIAAARDSLTKRSQVAGAIRLSLQDKSDLRTNKGFERAIDRLTYLRVDSARFVHDSLSERQIPRIPSLRSPAQQATADSIERAISARLHDGAVDQFASAIAAVKRAKEDAQWNADVFDVAVGVKGSSVDSTGKGPGVDGYSAWATKGWAVGELTQLLVGIGGSYERDSTRTMRGVGDAVARFYVGSNRAKALMEGQATGRASVVPAWLLRAGAELEVGQSFWVILSAGWQAAGSAPGRFTHSIKFSVTPPIL
jgi:hypothetical protein